MRAKNKISTVARGPDLRQDKMIQLYNSVVILESRLAAAYDYYENVLVR